ncbi:MAG: hypothetical protein NVS3B20_18490 [Polyangiales bacterium]
MKGVWVATFIKRVGVAADPIDLDDYAAQEFIMHARASQRPLEGGLRVAVGCFSLCSLMMLAGACRKTAQEKAPPASTGHGGSFGDEPEMIMPVETADQAALEELASLGELPSFRRRIYRQQSSHDRGKGDDSGIRLYGNGNRDLNNFVCKGEGADSGHPLIPLVFDLAQCPERYVKGLVLSRFEGSGQMTRLWLTALSLRVGSAGDQVLRIYVDDATTPLLKVSLAKAPDGSAGEMFAKPFGAESPHFLAWHYPVVFGKRLIVSIDRLGTLDTLYHQTDVALDAMPMARVAADPRLDARTAAKKALATYQPARMEHALVKATSFTLEPEKSVVVADLEGPATVRAVKLRVPTSSTSSMPARVQPATLAALDRIDLNVTWNESVSDAFTVTLAELFAATLDAPIGESLPLSATPPTTEGADQGLTLRLPMPFEKRARFTLTNHGPNAQTLQWGIDGDGNLPIAPFGHFFVQRNDTKGPLLKEGNKRHPLAHATGRGRYVGTCLMLQGHALSGADLNVDPFNFLEGNERGLIDAVLAIPGTGTEDYLDDAFYFYGGAKATPFAHVWGIKSDPTTAPAPAAHAQVSGCRWHVFNDAIDFNQSFQLDLEIGPSDPTLLDRYRSVGFLYR